MTAPKSARRDLAAFAIKHVTYPLWVFKNRSSLLRYATQLEASQYWSREQLLEHQWSAFKRLIAHAYGTCPYYQEKFRAAGVTPDDLRSRADIELIPAISKEEIQENGDRMVCTDYRRSDLILDKTGGSTGSPMQFYYDEDRQDSREAATLRHDRWAGWDLGARCAVLWGAPRDIQTMSAGFKARMRQRFIARRQILDASSLDEASMHAFAQELIRYQPTVIVAYANTLGLFAQYLQAENITGIHPQGIITSAEVLTPDNRRLIEQTFGCQVYNRYGCREFGVIASECSHHDGLHINAENLLVETAAENNSAGLAAGEILVTDLQNRAMPMIRYRIKDTGQLKEESCKCGRGLPLLELSGGRVSDFLTATNNKKVSGIVLATYVITKIPGIRQVQFVQREKQAVTINLVKGPAWSAQSLDALSGKTRELLGADLRIEVDFRDSIPFEKSGKYRFSISTLPAS